MCRRKDLHGWCMVVFGAGIFFGQCMDSWFWCGGGGLILICLGFSMLRHR